MCFLYRRNGMLQCSIYVALLERVLKGTIVKHSQTRLVRAFAAISSLSIVVLLITPAALAQPQIVSDVHIVVVDQQTNGNAHAKRDQVITSHGLTVIHVYGAALSGFSAHMNAAEATALSADPRVLSVTKDRPVYVDSGLEGQAVTRAKPGAGQILPTGVDRIDADRSSFKVGNGRTNLSGPAVAVIDTGIASHPDLNLAGGVDCITGTNDIHDYVGHGTHVAGSIGAVNNSQGVVGVAPGVPLYSARMFDSSGAGTWDAFICAANWVAANAAALNIRAANMSLTDDLTADTATCATSADGIHLAVCGMANAGVVPVAAAGNSAGAISGFVPAGFAEVLAVAGYRDSDGKPSADDQLSTFSNYATLGTNEVNHILGAPAENILSTWLNGAYAQDSGTSMASPHVTGTVIAGIARGRFIGVPSQIISQMMNDARNTSQSFGYAGDGYRPMNNHTGGYAVNDNLN
jgi:subtilisin